MLRKSKKGEKYLKKRNDVECSYILKINPGLEEWRVLAAEWLAMQRRSRSHRQYALDKFLLYYLHGLSLEMNPYTFLRKDYSAPSFFEHLGYASNTAVAYNNIVSEFLIWVLEDKLSVEDDYGHKVVPAEYWNPVPRHSKSSSHNAETYRVPLPYRYVRELRNMLCQGPDFRDWKWTQRAIDGARGDDWFEVTAASMIDETDPDCVWRTRNVPVYLNTSYKGIIIGRREVYELWSPARAVALYTKLVLPLRTHQVRMLESGEADTWRYEKGQWKLNDRPLATGSEKRPCMRGVFHRSLDVNTRKTMTGFYINTNKTADINKDEKDKGYVIPWQQEELLYWFEKLRNWQEKYNPLQKAIPWVELEAKHIGENRPPDDILEARGTACFLFRHAAAEKPEDRVKPLVTNALDRIWYRLLAELEKRCDVLGENLEDGSRIEFVVPNSIKTTHYPLHNLRVSLITAYALDGGVPFHILSKLIAGHARLIMTLYYTKAGKAHVTEIMSNAEKALLEKDKDGYRRFLANATYQQIEERFAINDRAALLAANQQKTTASFVFDDKGICIMGCGGCDVGGELLRENRRDPNQAVHGPVLGYPLEKNCVRCRFFITGPAFLPGLIVHFNNVSYQLTGCSDRYMRFEQEVNKIEELRHACEKSGQLFAKMSDLNRLSRLHEAEAQKVDKLGNDMHSTLKLIERCIQLLKRPLDKGVQLVPAGTITDIGYAFLETDSEMHQIEVICETAMLYPEVDASKAVLRRSQILDAMLELNGRCPVLFKLTPEQQLLVGNHVMQLIQQRVGSLKNAASVVEGSIQLAELGMIDETVNLIERESGLQPIPLGSIIPITLQSKIAEFPHRPEIDSEIRSN